MICENGEVSILAGPWLGDMEDQKAHLFHRYLHAFTVQRVRDVLYLDDLVGEVT